MPERGEVYLMTKRLRKRWPIGTTITKVRSYDTHMPINIPDDHYPLCVSKISSRSKKSYVNFDNGYSLLISYGMTAAWKIYKSQSTKYKFYCYGEATISEYYWQCVRKLHCETVVYMKTKKLRKELDKLGWDIYYDNPSDEEIINSYSTRGKNICGFLLDGTFAGIGNYIKSCLLYRCGISPYRNTKDLTDKEKVDIWNTAKEIVNEVIDMGGHCIQDFSLDDDKQLGEYDTTPYLPRLWKESGRPRDINKNIILRENIGGRVTYWCPKVQMR